MRPSPFEARKCSHLRMTASDDRSRSSCRTQNRARGPAARRFARRRGRACRNDLADLPRWRRLRRDQVRGRCARLCAGADARDLRRGDRKPERALRNQAGLRAGKPARCRCRSGNRDMGRGASIFVADKLYAAGCQHRLAGAGAGSRPRQRAASRLEIPTRRSRRRAGRCRGGRPCRGELHDR